MIVHTGALDAEIGGKVYLFGGSTRNVLSDRVLQYDPVTDTYADMDPFPDGPFKDASAVLAGGVVYLFGGIAAGNMPLWTKAITTND